MNAKTFWDKAAAKYAKAPIGNVDAYNETLLRIKAILTQDHDVVELGCGTGSTALELAAQVKSYVGTDISDKMIAIAKAKQDPSTPAHLTFAVGPADVLPDTATNTVLALNLLPLVPDLKGTLDAVYAALPSGGLFITKTPLLASLPWYVKLMIPVAQALGKAPFVRKLSEQDLSDALEDAGFETVETLVQDSGKIKRMFTVMRKP